MPFDIVINFEDGNEEKQYENLLKASCKKHKSINDKILALKDGNGLHNVYDIKMFKVVAKDDPRIIVEEASTQYNVNLLSTVQTQCKNSSKIVIEPPKPKRIVEDINEILDDVTSKINENHDAIQRLSEYCKRENAPTSYTSKLNKDLLECIRNSNHRIEVAKKVGERFNLSLITSPRNSSNCIAYLKSQSNLMTENKEWEIFKSMHTHELDQSVKTNQYGACQVSSLQVNFENKINTLASITPSIPREPRRSSISSVRKKPSIPSASSGNTESVEDVGETSNSKVYSSSPLNIHTINMRIGKGNFARDDDESNKPLRDREFLDASIELKKKQNIQGYPVNAMAFINDSDILFRDNVDEQVKNLTHIKGTERILKRNKKKLSFAIEQCRVKGRESINTTSKIIDLWEGYIQHLLYEQNKMVCNLKRREFHLPYMLEKRFQQYLKDIESILLPVDALNDSAFITQSCYTNNANSIKSFHLCCKERISRGEKIEIDTDISEHCQQIYMDILQKVTRQISRKYNVDKRQKLSESIINLLFIIKEILHPGIMEVIEFSSKDFFDIIKLGVRREVDYRDDLIFEIIMNFGKKIDVSLEEIYEFYKSNQFGLPPSLVTALRKYRQINITSGSFESDASIMNISVVNPDVSLAVR